MSLEVMLKQITGNKALVGPVVDVLKELRKAAEEGLKKDEIDGILNATEARLDTPVVAAALGSDNLKRAKELVAGLKAQSGELEKALKDEKTATAALNGYIEALEADTEEKLKKGLNNAQAAAPGIMDMIIMFIGSLLGMETYQIKGVVAAIKGGEAPAETPPAAAADAAPASPPATPKGTTPPAADPAVPPVIYPAAASGAGAKYLADLPAVSITPPNPSLRTTDDVQRAGTAWGMKGVELKARSVELDGQIATAAAGASPITNPDIKEQPTFDNKKYSEHLLAAHQQEKRGDILSKVKNYYESSWLSTATTFNHAEKINGEDIIIPLVNYDKNHGSEWLGGNWTGLGLTGNTIQQDVEVARDKEAQAKKDAEKLSAQFITDAKEYGAFLAKQSIADAINTNQPLNPQEFAELPKQISAAKTATQKAEATLKDSDKELGAAAEELAHLHAIVSTAADSRERPGKYRMTNFSGALSIDQYNDNNIKALETAAGLRYYMDGKKSGDKYVTIKSAEGKEMTFEIVPGGPYAVAKEQFEEKAEENVKLREALAKQSQELGALEARKELLPAVESHQTLQALKSEKAEVDAAIAEITKVLLDIVRIGQGIETREKQEADAKAAQERKERAAGLYNDAPNANPAAGLGMPAPLAGMDVGMVASATGDLPPVDFKPILAHSEDEKLDRQKLDAHLSQRRQALREDAAAMNGRVFDINGDLRLKLAGDLSVNRTHNEGDPEGRGTRAFNEMDARLERGQRASIEAKKSETDLAISSNKQRKTALQERNDLLEVGNWRGELAARDAQLETLTQQLAVVQNAASTLDATWNTLAASGAQSINTVLGSLGNDEQLAAAAKAMRNQAAILQQSGAVHAAEKLQALSGEIQNRHQDDGQISEADATAIRNAATQIAAGIPQLLQQDVKTQKQAMAALAQSHATVSTRIATLEGKLDSRNAEARLAPDEIRDAGDLSLTDQRMAARATAMSNRFHKAVQGGHLVTAQKEYVEMQKMIADGIVSESIASQFPPTFGQAVSAAQNGHTYAGRPSSTPSREPAVGREGPSHA